VEDEGAGGGMQEEEGVEERGRETVGERDRDGSDGNVEDRE
jgi:hypothetical protein